MKCQNTEHYQVNMKHKFSYINLSIHPPPNYLRTDWGAFVKLQAKAWLEMAVNWTTQAEAGRLRVLHYEELKEDPIPLLEDVLRFRGLDVDPLRLKCLKVLLLVFFFFFFVFTYLVYSFWICVFRVFCPVSFLMVVFFPSIFFFLVIVSFSYICCFFIWLYCFKCYFF